MAMRSLLGKLSVLLALAVGLAAPAWAGNPDTVNTVPSANSTFLPDVQNFLREEDADRFSEQFTGFVVSGGTHGTGAGLTGTPTALIAYPGGGRITETGSITYPNNDTCWVIATRAVTGDVTTFTRVSGTHYAIDCASVSLPATPTDAVMLMEVTTSGGSISAVTDLRIRSSVPPQAGIVSGSALTTPLTIGDILYAGTTLSWAILDAVTDGSVLRSAGTSTAPVWGKVRLSGGTTDTTGTLPVASGGTQTTTAPTDGQLLIGKTDGSYAVTDLTCGSNMTCTPGDGTLEIASSATAGTQVTDKVTADTTVTNTVVETAVYTKSISGGVIGTNSRIRLTLAGSIVNSSGTNRDLTIRLKYGATTLATAAVDVRNGITAGGAEIIAYLSADGATDAQHGLIRALSAGGSSSGRDRAAAGSGTAAEDSTGALNLVVTVQWAAASTNLTYVMRHAVAELLP
jgi:hypothetical protein